MMKQFIFFLVLFPAVLPVQGQTNSKRVFFVGNSYTAVNNLPQTIYSLALTVGDTLIYDSNTPGGQTFEGHFADVNTTGKIALGTWDYVVLQEQSQRPSFPDDQVAIEVFPFAKKLDSLIRLANPCTETMFYMTWGRQNGDAGNCAAWPPVCTYEGMDSLLRLRYTQLAVENEALLSPVGKVWHYLRTNYPALNLYSADGSHPSLAGTYAAACTFYTVIFQKDPSLITSDYGLSATDAANIRLAAKSIVFDSLENCFVGTYDPQADFSFSSLGGNELSFTNLSQHASSFSWDFGDGTQATDENPVHVFPGNGTYLVQLQVDHCGKSDVFTQNIQFASLKTLEPEQGMIAPNPIDHSIRLKLKSGLYRVKIVNNLGQIVLEKDCLSDGLIEISTENMAPGSYQLTVFEGQHQRAKSQFVKL